MYTFIPVVVYRIVSRSSQHPYELKPGFRLSEICRVYPRNSLFLKLPYVTRGCPMSSEQRVAYYSCSSLRSCINKIEQQVTDVCSCAVFIKQGSMKGMLVIVFQALLWPAVSGSGLFTVSVQKSIYEAEVHGDVQLVCEFSAVKSLSDIDVIWSRVNPKPEVKIFWLNRGQESHNYTSSAFIKRAQLIPEQLRENRAVLHLKRLRIKDSGTYQCIVGGDEVDYKQITLIVTAPYSPIKKSLRKVDEDEVELTCESQGFPSAQVFWSDGRNLNLTQLSNTSVRSTEEDLILIISKLKVERELKNNYTCSFVTKGEIWQSAIFNIPEEIPYHGSALFVWIGAVILVLLAIACIAIILSRRKYGQKNRRNEAFLFPHSSSEHSNSLLTVNETKPQTSAERTASLRELLTQQYSQLYTEAEMERKLLSYELHNREGRSLNMSSIIPDKKQIILLLGNSGSGKTTLTQILSSCWAESFRTDPFDSRRIRLVLLADCRQTKRDFKQLVNATVQYGKSLDVYETLVGPEDCLLILNGYQEGNKDLDETLEEFLRKRQMCRVLVTSQFGECPKMEKTARTVLHLIPKSV